MKKLLLISNSTQHGTGFLDHCADEIKDFLGANIKRVLFVPFASGNVQAYADKVRERFNDLEYKVDSLHETDSPAGLINSSEAIFIGGGNTFRLLNTLYQLDILETIKNKVEAGMPYIGSSAGSNVACPTIKTTNDMPIVYPPSFEALNLVPFNINAHYTDIHQQNHMGETREQRINEFHELNDLNVVGLREGTMLRIENNKIIFKGIADTVIFRKNEKPEKFITGSSLDFLLE